MIIYFPRHGMKILNVRIVAFYQYAMVVVLGISIEICDLMVIL